MSWLLAVSIPGLLMLATFGLGRVESRLEFTDPRADAIPDRPARPAPRAHSAQPSATAHLPRENHHRHPSPPPVVDDEPGLPTRFFGYASANPQFPPIRYTNPV